MLPILRILPVGGVLLAILILVLALSPPDGARPPLNTTIAPARGALVAREHHPETRQFLIMAALRRADELSRLRELPDTPTRTEMPGPEALQPEEARPEEPSSEAVASEPIPQAPKLESAVEPRFESMVEPMVEPKVAGLPSDPADAEPDEPPAAIDSPPASIPAEASDPPAQSLEAAEPAKTTAAPEKPEQARPQREPKRRSHRVHRSKAAARSAQRPFNLFEALFGGQQYQQKQRGAQQSAQYQQPANAYQQQYQYQQPTVGSQLQLQQQQQQQQATQPVPDPYLSRPKYY